MTACIDCALALMVFVGIVCRLANVQKCHRHDSSRSIAAWHLWVTPNVAVGLGAIEIAVAPLVGDEPPRIGVTLMLVGMALLMGLRWRRRASE